ncbi:E3 ubiquitin-protein ligase DCST1-like [Lithobates pipiens]
MAPEEDGGHSEQNQLHTAEKEDVVQPTTRIQPETKRHCDADSTKPGGKRKRKKSGHKKKAQKAEKPASTSLKRFADFAFPSFLTKFLFGEINDFKLAKFFLGFGIGSLMGVAIYLSLIDGLKLPYGIKLPILFFLAGPLANIQNNGWETVRSIGCTAELQINNTKLLWKMMSTPVKSILKNIVKETRKFNNIGTEVKSSFADTKEEVEGKKGYDIKKEEQLLNTKRTTTTQKKFDIKTMLRCEYIISLGVSKCEEWFEIKHVGESWCKKRIPIEDHFGEVYDQANSAVTNVGSGISSKLITEKEDDVGAGENLGKISMKDKILAAVERRGAILQEFTAFLKGILVLTFIFIFYTAFNYIKLYNTDIRHDNLYLTTHFRQIDTRRRKQKKRYLLPMRKEEISKLIVPFNLKIQASEMALIRSDICICVILVGVLILLLMFDGILFHILDIIRKHSYISYVFASNHKLEVEVGGDTLMANLLRRTVGILNSTSNTFETSSNEMCLLRPTKLTFWDYAITCLPIVGRILFAFLQVYLNRLRRVIASYYYPEREKERIVCLYNEQLLKRAIYAEVKRKQILNKVRMKQINKPDKLIYFRHYTSTSSTSFTVKPSVPRSQKLDALHRDEDPYL